MVQSVSQFWPEYFCFMKMLSAVQIGAGYGTRTRFAGLGSQGTTHIPTPLSSPEFITTPNLAAIESPAG